MRSSSSIILAIAALLGTIGAAHAQGYPARPVTIIVVYAPGGTSDITTRILAQRLTESFGRQFVVDNRSGGGGIVGWNAGSRAAPDGYTLIALETGFAMTAGLIPNLPFDPRRDFTYLSQIATVPMLMVVPPSLPVKSVQEFIALAKANPDKVNYASAGTGSGPHLLAELFRSLTGVQFTHIPYKGGGPANQAVISNEAQVVFTAAPTAMNFVKAGKLKALMVTGEKRLAALPDVPSAPEVGMPKMVTHYWFVIAAPAKTPPEITNTLASAIASASQHPATRERFAELGLEVVGNEPAQAAQLIDGEIQRWSALVKAAGIKPD